MVRAGLFGVRFDIVDNSICAVLTGDRYSGDESIEAIAAFENASDNAMAMDSSPVYLVRDTVVRMAVQMMRRTIRDEAVDCHEGENGSPCGCCKTCETAKREAFSHVLIGNLAIPVSDLHDRIDKAVRSAIGLAWADSPWRKPFTDEEVGKVFEELGVTPKKGKNK